MLEFYYVRTLEKCEIALLDVFNDLRVNKYTDITRTTYTKTVPIPIFTHSDKNFANYWRNSLSKKQPMPLPCAGLRLKGISPDNPNRTQTTYPRRIFSKATQQWIEDIQPTPFVISYDLELICDNRSDFGQIVENVIPYFNTFRTLRIKEFDFAPDIEAKIPVYMDSINPQFEDEIENTSAKHRLIRLIVSFRLNVDLYRPFEIPDIIKYAELNLNIDSFRHMHQVLIYPDPIAQKEKKEWESLAPSARNGMTLLKTVAGTLVKQVNFSDGTSAWKDITVPSAKRPIKVPNFKELKLLFNDISPIEDEIDQSGFDRDFTALNSSTVVFNPDLEPDGGKSTPTGWKPSEDNNWNNILTWFGTEDGLNGSPFSFDITLQFNNTIPQDSIFQTLHNQTTENYNNTNQTLDAGEVYFEWGIIGNQLYFTLRTVAWNKAANDFVEVLSSTFTTNDKLILNNTDIYKFIFVLYDKGREGMFGYSVDGGPVIALNTKKE